MTINLDEVIGVSAETSRNNIHDRCGVMGFCPQCVAGGAAGKGCGQWYIHHTVTARTSYTALLSNGDEMPISKAQYDEISEAMQVT